jgi:V8-like Glu-specific endopeptidase
MHLPGMRPAGCRERYPRAVRMAGACALALGAVVWPTALAGSAVVTAPAPLMRSASGGNPAVGAMFSTSGGRLGTHFCTASVIDSPAGDLLVTAAHCVNGFSDASPANLAFVPGFANGTAPYGVWTVTRIFVDSAWTSSADPDHDVAFLVVQQHGSNTRIQNVTGGERLGIGQPSTGIVRVIGYPDTRDQPISCQNRTSAFGSGQMQFDCANYTTGTSGSPFLIDVNAVTGEGTVIGVLGGYQQGGDSSDVSYAAAFGKNVQALYDTATSGP